jgi:hypothetical protein
MDTSTQASMAAGGPGNTGAPPAGAMDMMTQASVPAADSDSDDEADDDGDDEPEDSEHHED